MQGLSPFVYWTQDASCIYLRVDLQDTEDLKINVTTNSLSMSAKGVGANGTADYSLLLDFYSEIECDIPEPKTLSITLNKASKGLWPRLLSTQQKPPWLKTDFQKWKSEDDDLIESVPEDAMKDIIGDYPELYEKLKKEEFGYVKEDIKKVYLVFYNLMQFVFFTYILIVMGIRFFKLGPESMDETYEAVGGALKFAQLLQYLEVMHPLFGYTKGNVMNPLMQVTGRCFVLFAMIESEERMWRKPVVAWLIIVWAVVEIIRYPYYIAEIYKKNFGLLTWLRYTIWIPLYPLGALCEGIIIIRNIPYFEETQRFVVSLPNTWNFSFHMPTAMRVYLLVFFFPGLCRLMAHMYRVRNKKLSTGKYRTRPTKKLN